MLNTLRTALFLAAALALAAPAWTHGDHENIMGTVKEITEKTLTIETADKKTRTVAYDGQTRFEKSGEPATAADLRAGERVVVEIHQVEGKAHAARVRFGPPRRTG